VQTAEMAGMKKRTQAQPSQKQSVSLKQICELIPPYEVAKIGRETGVDKQARSFTPWSHVVTMVYSQISHSVGLNDVCDALRLREGELASIRGALPPERSTLSHANKTRDSGFAQKLFWTTLAHTQQTYPGFVREPRPRFAHRFRRNIQLADSTVIPLVASCMDWAKHRRRKAAAKCHLRLDLQSFLPKFAIIDTANEHDSTRAWELCAGLKDGEIVIFDKAYGQFAHLYVLEQRGVYFVTRAKDNLNATTMRKGAVDLSRGIVRDDLVRLNVKKSAQDYPALIRVVTLRLEVDGQEREMTFLTNHLTWSPISIGDLYRSRWEIEVFFREIKQSLQLTDFLGNSANAVQWQVWIALLVHLLLRWYAWQSRWHHSFTRLFTFVRAALWLRKDLLALLRRYGTANGHFRFIGQAQQAWLPGFAMG
jgi:hypothetical protein